MTMPLARCTAIIGTLVLACALTACGGDNGTDPIASADNSTQAAASVAATDQAAAPTEMSPGVQTSIDPPTLTRTTWTNGAQNAATQAAPASSVSNEPVQPPDVHYAPADDSDQ